MRPPPNKQRTSGVSGPDIQIEGAGHVAWAVIDESGMLRTLKVPAFYAPTSRVRLLSTTSLLNTYKDETISLEQGRLVLSGNALSNPPTRGIVVPINRTNNLAVSDARKPNDFEPINHHINSFISEVHHSNLNLRRG